MNKIQNKLRDLSTRQLKYILLQLHAKKNIKQITIKINEVLGND